MLEGVKDLNGENIPEENIYKTLGGRGLTKHNTESKHFRGKDKESRHKFCGFGTLPAKQNDRTLSEETGFQLWVSLWREEILKNQWETPAHVSTTPSCTDFFHYFFLCMASLLGMSPPGQGPPCGVRFALSRTWPVAGTSQTFMNERMRVAGRKGRGRELPPPEAGKNESRGDGPPTWQWKSTSVLMGSSFKDDVAVRIGKEIPHPLPKYHYLDFMPRKLAEMHASKNSVR